MKKTFLLTSKLQIPGWILISISAILFILCFINQDVFDFSFKFPALYADNIAFFGGGSLYDRHWFTIVNAESMTTLIPSLYFLGCLFVGFSKEKQEDELTTMLRERSLVWTMLVYYALYVFVALFVYGIFYLYVRTIIFYLLPLTYILLFKISLYRLRKESDNEE
ncbi:MAG: hypothetical protein MJZ71_06985 [Bacteroidales bacterium]|nr:hypothetical protein [Bacteroidales bacterium]